jgi:predicted nicotinamide N-methyase
MSASTESLQQRLNATLPTARIEVVELPDVANLKLGLINADFSTEPLAQEVMRKVIAKPAYWAFCWGSGLASALWLQANAHKVEGKVIADVGCGSGVVAIAAALAGAQTVYACDIDDDALLATETNAKLNNTDIKLCSHIDQLPDNLDQIWMADVLYDRANLPLIEQVKAKAQSIKISDSRVRDLEDPDFHVVGQAEALTYPNLGEFDEFRVVNFFEYRRR